MTKEFRIAVTGEKGGPGKTTFALEFSIIASWSGLKTTLIDCDPQLTSSALLERRRRLIAKAEFDGTAMASLSMPNVLTVGAQNLQATLDQEAENGAQFQVVDLAGRDDGLVREALKAVDVAVIPLRPTAPDLKTATKFDVLVGVVKQAKGRFNKAYFVINQAPTNAYRKAAQIKKAVDVLTGEHIENIELLDMAVSERYAFVKGWLEDDDAYSVTEIAGAEKASEEIMGVFERVTKVATSEVKESEAA